MPRGAQILHLSGAVAGFRANCTYGYRMLMLVPFPWIGRWDGLGALFWLIWSVPLKRNWGYISLSRMWLRLGQSLHELSNIRPHHAWLYANGSKFRPLDITYRRKDHGGDDHTLSSFLRCTIRFTCHLTNVFEHSKSVTLRKLQMAPEL
jgi:hypothetical protein